MTMKDGSLLVESESRQHRALAALQQISGLLSGTMGCPVTRDVSGSGFGIVRPEGWSGAGILEVRGRISRGPVVKLCFRIATISDTAALSGGFLKALREITALFPETPGPGPDADGALSIWVEMQGEAAPLGVARESAFLTRVQELNTAAEKLQAHIPEEPAGSSDLEALYKPLEKALEPALPWQPASTRGRRALRAWLRSAIDFLEGGRSLAVASPCGCGVDLSMAVLAGALQARGSSLGRSRVPQLTCEKLVELAQSAPGVCEVPAISLALGANPYHTAGEVKSMLAILEKTNRQIVFTGAMNDLQQIFHGGQGGACDPLQPVVLHVPEVPLADAADFAVGTLGRAEGGLAKAIRQQVVRELCAALRPHPPGLRLRYLPPAAAHCLRARSRPGGSGKTSAREFVARLGSATETLGGLNAGEVCTRSAHVQEHYLARLTDPGLQTHMQECILGQQEAVRLACDSLQQQIAMRPAGEPLRLCAVGTPGTGKSQFADSLARWLGVPCEIIDASALDARTARSMLLGSSRGIVGSYESGVLEQMARHHTGCVAEICDIDHMHPDVRAEFSSTFLQVLQKGMARSGTGAVFSCAGIVFVFTMNLPNGLDERLARPLGFGSSPGSDEVRAKVIGEMKTMLNGAIVSRLGMPVYFADLQQQTLERIFERSLAAAVRTAAENHHVRIGTLSIAPGLGAALLGSRGRAGSALGARVVQDAARASAAAAFLRLVRAKRLPPGRNLRLTADAAGNLGITEEK